MGQGTCGDVEPINIHPVPKNLSLAQTRVLSPCDICPSPHKNLACVWQRAPKPGLAVSCAAPGGHSAVPWGRAPHVPKRCARKSRAGLYPGTGFGDFLRSHLELLISYQGSNNSLTPSLHLSLLLSARLCREETAWGSSWWGGDRAQGTGSSGRGAGIAFCRRSCLGRFVNSSSLPWDCTGKEIPAGTQAQADRLGLRLDSQMEAGLLGFSGSFGARTDPPSRLQGRGDSGGVPRHPPTHGAELPMPAAGMRGQRAPPGGCPRSMGTGTPPSPSPQKKEGHPKNQPTKFYCPEKWHQNNDLLLLVWRVVGG